MFPMLCFVLDIAVVSLVGAENVAYKKPAAQGSTWRNCTADKAVNGMYVTNAGSGQYCAHVRYKSWWTVDLQNIYSLHTIVIFNRDSSQERLDDLSVEGFLTEPHFASKAFFCAYHAGPSGDVVTLSCRNGTQGRYVRLRGKTDMTLCQVEIYGEKVMTSPGCDFDDVPILSGMTSTPATQLGNADHRASCLSLCYQHPTCNVAGYNHVTKMCTSHFVPLLPVADSETTLFLVP